MGREIKFRAFDGKDYVTKPFTLLDIQNGKIQFASSDTVIMQYTGLKDKDGKEIYEGDILDGHSDGYTVVEYTEANGGYDCVFTDDNSVGIAELTSWFGNQAMVRGNIYQNPELLNHV